MRIASQVASSSLSLPKDSYIYKVIPVHGTQSLAAISSDDSLRLFDAASLRLSSNGLRDKVHDGVTCLNSFSADRSCILTAGRDAVVRCWDLRSREAAFEIKHRRFCSISPRWKAVKRVLGRNPCTMLIAGLLRCQYCHRYRLDAIPGGDNNLVGNLRGGKPGG